MLTVSPTFPVMRSFDDDTVSAVLAFADLDTLLRCFRPLCHRLRRLADAEVVLRIEGVFGW